MSDLRVELREGEGARLLVCAGWIDISNVAELNARIDAALGEAGVARVGLDLAAAEYIDSATVSALIRAKHRAEEHGRLFGLCGLSQQVTRVLQETHLIEIFPLFPTPEAFLAGDDPTAA